MSNGGTRFQQVLRVDDFRIESGAEAEPGPRGTVRARNVVRVWLIGQPALEHGRVTCAFLEARSDWGEEPLPLPRFDFSRRQIVIAYTLASIQPVVSMLLDGVQLYCQFRELEGGAVYADVHKPQASPTADVHWVRPD